jgi:hypothetical protein
MVLIVKRNVPIGQRCARTRFTQRRKGKEGAKRHFLPQSGSQKMKLPGEAGLSRLRVKLSQTMPSLSA